MSAQALWGKVAKTHTIHQETLHATEQASKLGYIPLDKASTLKRARKSIEKFLTHDQDSIVFKGKAKELIVPSEHFADGIPITVYKASKTVNSPAIIVYFHGGGLVLCSRKTHAGCVRMLCKKSGCIVINVEYRLLPCTGDRFAPFKDPITVAKWVLKNKEVVGGSNMSKVAVAGDGAGGQIASVVGNEVKGLSFQILINPMTDLCCLPPSFEEFRDIPVPFNTNTTEAMLGTYGFPISDIIDNPCFNPGARRNLWLSPPTIMVLAELDPLVDLGLAYVLRLRAARVGVQVVKMDGVPSIFFSAVQHFRRTATHAHEAVAKYIHFFQ